MKAIKTPDESPDAYSNRPFFLRITMVVALMIVCVTGCKSEESDGKKKEKSPRPVEVQTLAQSAAAAGSLVTASVASWKTEQIEMEVSGRILWVAEPNTDIEGRVVDSEGNVTIEGTPIARIDDVKYRLQVETAKAQVERAKQNILAAKTELEKSLPAQMRAAKAESKLALTEFERSKRLFDQNAGAQSDVDRDEARYESALSTIEQLKATTNAKTADINSLNLILQQDKESLKDAEKNLKDCTLYSSFRGQISSVEVVPGSVVNSGAPVATIQMMDPIKIELEVSSEDSRRLRNRQRLPVIVTDENGIPKEEDGFLYLIDSVADSQTRTFTIALLVMNQRANVGSENNSVDATIDQTWRLDLPFIPGAEPNKLYVGEKAILEDAEGAFLWRIENVRMHESMPKDRLLKVRKMRVRLGDARLPFLGNWVFREVEVLDDTFDPKEHMVAAELFVKNGTPDDWDGETILFQNSAQWKLRPGDLVKVDISENDQTLGMYVPMDAVSHQQGKYYLFLLDEAASPDVVRRTEIRFVESEGSEATSSLLNVEAVNEDVNLEGRKYVTRGAHYLRDGEPVKVVASEGVE